MQNREVRVCVCAGCMLSGAQELIVMTEQLAVLENELCGRNTIAIKTSKLHHPLAFGDFPLVVIDGRLLRGCTKQQAGERIVQTAQPSGAFAQGK